MLRQSKSQGKQVRLGNSLSDQVFIDGSATDSHHAILLYSQLTDGIAIYENTHKIVVITANCLLRARSPTNAENVDRRTVSPNRHIKTLKDNAKRGKDIRCILR